MKHKFLNVSNTLSDYANIFFEFHTDSQNRHLRHQIAII